MFEHHEFGICSHFKFYPFLTIKVPCRFLMFFFSPTFLEPTELIYFGISQVKIRFCTHSNYGNFSELDSHGEIFAYNHNIAGDKLTTKGNST